MKSRTVWRRVSGPALTQAPKGALFGSPARERWKNHQGMYESHRDVTID